MFSIHRRLFLALKKVRIVKTTHSQVPSIGKKIPPVKFPIPLQPLTAIWETPIYKTLRPLFVDGVHLPQVYTEPI